MNATLSTRVPALRRSPAPATQFDAYLLSVDFESPDGETWSAVGGGPSVQGAIAAARDALPDGPVWDVVSWNHLYGD